MACVVVGLRRRTKLGRPPWGPRRLVRRLRLPRRNANLRAVRASLRGSTGWIGGAEGDRERICRNTYGEVRFDLVAPLSTKVYERRLLGSRPSLATRFRRLTPARAKVRRTLAAWWTLALVPRVPLSGSLPGRPMGVVHRLLCCRRPILEVDRPYHASRATQDARRNASARRAARLARGRTARTTHSRGAMEANLAAARGTSPAPWELRPAARRAEASMKPSLRASTSWRHTHVS